MLAAAPTRRPEEGPPEPEGRRATLPNSSMPGNGPGLAPILDRWFLPIVALLAVAAVVTIYVTRLSFSPLRSDAEAYYVYLPAYLLQHDFHLEHVGRHTFGLLPIPGTHYMFDHWSIGVAVMLLPFFAVGQLISVAIGAGTDGYSDPDQFLVVLAGIVYLLVGLAILRALLRRYFSREVVLGTLVVTVFGTSVFHYAVYDPGYSHVYSFMLVAAMALLVHRWHSGHRATWRVSLLLGLVVGLIALVRLPNLVIVLLLPLYGLTDRALLRRQLSRLFAARYRLGLSVLVAALTFLPQSLVWHHSTGHWVLNSYQYLADAGAIDLTHPRLIEVLFGQTPQSILLMAPILGVAIVGLLWLRARARPFALACAVTVLVHLYLATCWTVPTYGESFGYRTLVDFMPLWAFPLASVFSSIKSRSGQFIAITGSAVLVLSTMAQMVHYWEHLIPDRWSGMTDYLRVLILPWKIG